MNEGGGDQNRRLFPPGFEKSIQLLGDSMRFSIKSIQLSIESMRFSIESIQLLIKSMRLSIKSIQLLGKSMRLSIRSIQLLIKSMRLFFAEFPFRFFPGRFYCPCPEQCQNSWTAFGSGPFPPKKRQQPELQFVKPELQFVYFMHNY
jgi:hypothetical protein